MNLPADPETWRAALLEAGWLKRVEWRSLVDSTNTWARQSTDGGLPALFVADQQTHGRGRGENSWWSPSGCLMMTLAVSSTTLPTDQSKWNQLSLLVGLAAAEAIERVCPNLSLRLKWPNDVYVAGFKVGGILIESVSSGSDTRFLIGVGINVHIDWSAAPEDVRQRATCLTNQAGRVVHTTEILIQLIQSLRERIVSWQPTKSDWLELWRDRCLLTGRIVSVSSQAYSDDPDNHSWLGRCEGVSSDGRLLIRREQGEVIAVGAGEVRLKHDLLG